MQFVLLFLLLFTSLNALTNVELKLKWKNQFQFAGYYVAKEKGYYKINDLDVRIDELSISRPLDDVLNKDLVFGISDSSLIFNKMMGSNITALMANFQTSPLALISLKNSSIKTPLDLKNRVIEVPSFSEANSSIYAMLKAYDVNFTEKLPTFDINDLISQRTDSISGYISNEPYKLNKRGYESVIFNPKDFGYDFYGDILFTSDETLKKYSSEVNAFVEASIKGWLYAFENIEETVDLILEKYNTQNKTKDELLYEAKILKDLAGNLDRFGELDLNKVKNIASIFTVLLPNKYQVESINEFIYFKNPLFLEEYYRNDLNLTKEELNYLINKNSFNICTNPSSYPLSGYLEGKLTGVMGNVFDEISKKLNVNFNAIAVYDYDEFSSKVKNNKCDFIDMIDTAQNEFKNITTSKKLKSSTMLLVGNKNSLIPKNEDDLRELVIYTNFKRYQNALKLVYPKLEVKYEPDLNKIRNNLLESTKNKYFVPMELSKEFLFQNKKYDFKTTFFFSEIKNNISIGINNNSENLIKIINKAIENLGIDYISSIIDKYMFYINNQSIKRTNNLILTNEEISYLNSINFEIYLTNWEPFAYKKDDKFEGFAIKYFEELFKNYDLKYNYVLKDNFTESLESFKKNPNALIISTTASKDKAQYSNFSIPYEKFEIALATKNDVNYIYDFNSLNDKKIAVGKHFSAYHIIKKYYPKIDFIFTNNTIEALEKVSNGEAFGAIDILPVVNTLLTKYNIEDLKIAGLSKEFFDLQFMVNNQNIELIPIINKLISDFDDIKLTELRNSLFKVKKEEPVNLTVYYIAITVLFIVVLILIIVQLVSNKSRKAIENEKLKFKSLMENASDGIHILNLKGDIIECNKTFADSLGYSIDEIKNMNVYDWEVELSEDDIEQTIMEISKKPKSFSTKHKRKDGVIIDVDINAKGITLDNEHYLYASSRDLSEIKRAYEKIEELNKKLNILNKNLENKIQDAVDENLKQQAILVHQNRLAQLGEMMSMIAHQWRQPLSAISVWVSNIVYLVEEKNYKISEIKEIEDKVKEIVLHLSLTIDEFKNYYQTENKKKEFHLSNTIENSLKLLSNKISDNSILLESKSLNSIKLFSYENLLKQVLVAIVSNAIDVLKDVENNRIELVSKLENDIIKIDIIDNGSGIPTEIQEKIFDPYFTTKGDLNGTGLGLYMSKMIIEKSFKGNLDFETSSNGTTFKIEFPLKENS